MLTTANAVAETPTANHPYAEIEFEAGGEYSKASDIGRTALIHLTPGRPKSRRVVVITARDAGAAVTLIPVIRLLRAEAGIDAWLFANGKALRIIREEIIGLQITANDHPCALFARIPRPQIVLTAGAWSDFALETLVLYSYPSAVLVAIENTYGQAHPLLGVLKKHRNHDPAAVCVIDPTAREDMAAALACAPEIVHVTGQPAYDAFSADMLEETRNDVRARFGLGRHDKLVVWLTTPNTHRLVVASVPEMARCVQRFRLAIRPHTSDEFGYSSYRSAIVDARCEPLDTMTDPSRPEAASCTNLEAIHAADVVLSTHSMDATAALYLGTQTGFVRDARYLDMKRGQKAIPPHPPTRLGAAADITYVTELSGFLGTALNPRSASYLERLARMQRNYRADGQASSRVVDVVRSLLA